MTTDDHRWPLMATDDPRFLPVLPDWAQYGLAETAWPKWGMRSSQCGCAECDLSHVFGIIFPAVCGLMEGANLSGDLADPGFAIPYGTLAAVSTAFFFYIMLIFGQVSPRTSDDL